MKEIQEILKKIKTLKSDEKAILATVVDVQGSSYRLPGAKMLILENGETYGTVSGGCLEADVLERAKKVMETGEPQVFVYDTTKDLDSVFSLNMGCRGIIQILLEPISQSTIYIKMLNDAFCSNELIIWATCIDAPKPTDSESIGNRWTFDKDGVWTNLPSWLEGNKTSGYFTELRPDIQSAVEQKKPSLKTYQTSHGKLSFFIDYLFLPTNLTIFGAGADAVPLAEIAKSLGWFVKVVDHREKFANKERFAKADEILISHPENTAENISVDENSISVIMTHNYEHDKNILRVLLKSNAKYIGKLGPKRRSENMLREFADEGLTFTNEELQKLHSPIGLDIGADTPEAIALSIVAEIQAVLKNREGGFLRNRKGSIYGRD